MSTSPRIILEKPMMSSVVMKTILYALCVCDSQVQQKNNKKSQKSD